MVLTKKIFSIWFLYYYYRFHGFIPFNYEFKLQRTFTSAITTVFSFFLSIFFIMPMAYALYGLLKYLTYQKYKTIFSIVFITKSFFTVMRMLIMYWFQWFYRKKFMYFIDRAFKIAANLNKMYPFSVFFDKHCRHWLKIRLFYFGLQILLTLLAMNGYRLQFSDLYTDVEIASYLFTYFNLLKTLTASIFICSTIVVLQFYRIINCKLIELKLMIRKVNDTKQMKISYCYDVNDEMDKVTKYFFIVSQFFNELNWFYEFQVLWGMVDVFFTILYKVWYIKYMCFKTA